MFNKNRACQHLRLQGVSSTESSRWAALVKKWHDNNGPEWTVDRIKSLEHYAKERYLGKYVEIPAGWATTSSRRYNKRFKDDLLHELFSSKEFDFELAMQFTRLTTALSLTRWKTFRKGKRKWKRIVQLPPSKKQLSKTLTAIEGPPNKAMDVTTYESVTPYLEDVDNVYQWRYNKYPDPEQLEVTPMVFQPVTEVTAPYFDENGQIKTAQRNSEQACWSLEILYNDHEFATFTR